jgi:putative ABC transport system permease protein
VAAVLYGVTPVDATTLAAGSGLMVVIGMLATWLPARRAARIDPMAALRES